MKMMKILCTAAVLILAAALIGCNDDDGGLSLPGGKNVKDLQNYDVSTVTSEDEAISLLSGVISGSNNLFTMLEAANEEAYNAAFEKKYEKKQSEYFTSKSADKSISVSVDIDDTEKLKDQANVTIASIKGKSRSSISSNLSLLQIGSSLLSSSFLSNGDWYSSSDSINKTFAITDGFYEFTRTTSYPTTTTTYKVAGYIIVEAEKSVKSTLKDKGTNKYETSSSSYEKGSATLTISNGTKGAKFRISYGFEHNSKVRSTETNSGSIYSDIEVYNNDNVLLYTISSSKSNAPSLGNLAARFFD